MRTIKRLMLVTWLLAAFPFSAFPWDNNITHPGLTNRAVDYLIQSDPYWSFLANYAHFNLAEDEELTHLDEGSVKEDFGVSAGWDTNLWGSRQDSRVPELSWMGHGFNPVTGEAWYDVPDIHNALEYSADIMNDIQAAGNFYFQVGRFLHLIEDMGSVPHAHADTHALGDDLETFGQHFFHTVNFTLAKSALPSLNGLSPQTGLLHGDLRANTYQNFIKNVVWRTYYMTSYYGGNLVKDEGDRQPDSELKRMFPYAQGGLRYDDGGWLVNDSFVIDQVGNNWIGWGIGMNPDWWDCPDDPGYFYLENIDGDPESSDPSSNGVGTAPAVFKIDKFRRVRPSDNLNLVLASNQKILARIYAEEMFKLTGEWVAGFIDFIH